MPSNAQRVSAVILSALLFVGGAGVASTFHRPVTLPESSSTGEVSHHGIEATVRGAREKSGQIVVMVFDDPSAFKILDPYAAAGYLTVAASVEALRLDFPDLYSDYYAVIAFHDSNGNGVLDYDEDGSPTEGYAVSGINSVYEEPVFEYSLVEPGSVDLTLFYWND